LSAALEEEWTYYEHDASDWVMGSTCNPFSHLIYFEDEQVTGSVLKYMQNHTNKKTVKGKEDYIKLLLLIEIKKAQHFSLIHLK
jgi:hypothetical protein